MFLCTEWQILTALCVLAGLTITSLAQYPVRGFVIELGPNPDNTTVLAAAHFLGRACTRMQVRAPHSCSIPCLCAAPGVLFMSHLCHCPTPVVFLAHTCCNCGTRSYCGHTHFENC